MNQVIEALPPPPPILLRGNQFWLKINAESGKSNVVLPGMKGLKLGDIKDKRNDGNGNESYW